MKNNSEFLGAVDENSLLEGVSNQLFAEWNLNRYISDVEGSTGSESATIAFQDWGTPDNGSTEVTPYYPPSILSGDLLVLFVVNKYPPNGPTTPSGWTLQAQASGGAGSSGVDSGNVYVTVYTKVADGTETGFITISVPSANSSDATILSYRSSDTTSSWLIDSAYGSENTAGTDWSVTTNALSVSSGDLVVAITGVNAAPVYPTEPYDFALAMSGVAFDTPILQWEGGSTLGDDLTPIAVDFPVLTGTADIPATYSHTFESASGNYPAGATVLLRLRKTVGATEAEDVVITVPHTVPETAEYDAKNAEIDQISSAFPVESIVTPHRSNKSSYVIQGTSYVDGSLPVYVNQKARTDLSWQNDTTWLWHGHDAPFQYWVSPLKSNANKNIPFNAGLITYTWSNSVPMNKIRILFQMSNATPVNWTVSLDMTGDGGWTVISTNAVVPSSGEFSLWRSTEGSPGTAGTWVTPTRRWSPAFDNHVEVYGIKVNIQSVNIINGRPAIIELSPRLDTDLTEFLTEWSLTEELADQDFISPIGSASANVGSVTLSNDLGTFNEYDQSNIFYKMLDEEVLFTGYLNYGDESIQMFSMLSDSWEVTDFDSAVVNLVDKARILQNTPCKDMILSNISVGTAFHSLFAGLGLEQFNILEATPKQTPVLEKFYVRKEQKVWEVIQSICKSLQLSAFFNAYGQMVLMTKEEAYNPDAGASYTLISENQITRKSNIFSLQRQENARFNKVIVRYNAINNFSLSGSRNQKMWSAPDPWTIGAAQIVKNIYSGDDYFVIDPNRPEDLPRFSGKIVIEDFDHVFDYSGKQYYCKNAPTGAKHIIARKPSDYWLAVENNDGQAPRFTGKVYLKGGQTFHRNFKAKNFGFYEDWDVISYPAEGTNGKVSTTGAKHVPVDGCLTVTTDFTGGRRLNITKKQKNWNRFDRVGMKFKVKSNDSKVGLVVWPQGTEGASGYYFTVDPMSTKEISKVVAANTPDTDTSTRPPPEIKGFIMKTNGQRVDMEFDSAKDFKNIPPLKVDKWSYLEVAIYSVTGGFEFEVYVNGQYCKTFTDTTVKLSRNEKAGMTFMGAGTILVDNFYVINYPADSIRSKDKDDGGFVVRRMDLWRDRKAASGDRSFDKYLKMMERMKKTKVFNTDFSGRYHGIAREKVVEHIRFEQPAITSEFVSSNKAVSVVDYNPGSFGAKVVLINKSERSQLLKGTVQTKVSGAERNMTSYIYGKSFRVADPQEVTYKDDNSIDKLGPLLIEFDSEWIQDRDTAEDLATWVRDRFEQNSEVYSVEIFGNPSIEIGDTVSISWPEKGLTSSEIWAVTRIESSWKDGLNTTLTVRRII